MRIITALTFVLAAGLTLAGCKTDTDELCENCGDESLCDQNNPDADPDADEICDDELDNDCDLYVDMDDPDCADSDGDGWVDGLDCEDFDASIHPGADEDCEDGLDNDCDSDTDGDDEECGGDDDSAGP